MLSACKASQLSLGTNQGIFQREDPCQTGGHILTQTIAQHGLGLLITTAMSTFQPDGVFAGMVIIAVIALAAEGLIAALEKRVLGWRPAAQTESAAI